MEFKHIVEGKPPEMAAIANYLRHLISSEFPELKEGIFGGKKVKMALYHLGEPNNVALGISPGDHHCQVFIHHFDKVNLRGLKLHGKGKHARHFKFYTKSEAEASELKEVFRAVVAIARSKHVE